MAAKRGAGRLMTVDLDGDAGTDPDADVLAVHDVLDRLGAVRSERGRIRGLALLRWSNPVRGSRGPGYRLVNRLRLAGPRAGLAGGRHAGWLKIVRNRLRVLAGDSGLGGTDHVTGAFA